MHVVHGDIKPTDIRVSFHGWVKLTGFGVACALRDATQRAQFVERAGDAVSTGRLAGATVGTPEYLAPEQLIGAPATPASDLYAVGIVLRECLIGHTPRRGDMPVTLIGGRLRTSSTEHPLAPTVSWPPPLDAVITIMTESDPARRIRTAAYLLDLLERPWDPRE